MNTESRTIYFCHVASSDAGPTHYLRGVSSWTPHLARATHFASRWAAQGAIEINQRQYPKTARPAKIIAVEG